MVDLEQDVRFIKGVGPSRVEILKKLNIRTLEDLITYFPRDYEDRSKYKQICELQDGETAAFKAVIQSNITENRIRKGMTIYKAIASDGTDSVLLTWFNQTYIKKMLKPHEEYLFYGKVKVGIGRKEVQSAIFELENEHKNIGKIVPIYPLTEGITGNVLRSIIQNGVETVKGELIEDLPEEILQKYHLWGMNEAIPKIHFPNDASDFELARYRIAFEELFITELALLSMKEKGKTKDVGIRFSQKGRVEELLKSLPYELTSAQMRVWTEICHDMESTKPMNRLVQGDVGSGKTVVATLAMLKAVGNGYQAAMMAPTAILAKQHYLRYFKNASTIWYPL